MKKAARSPYQLFSLLILSVSTALIFSCNNSTDKTTEETKTDSSGTNANGGTATNTSTSSSAEAKLTGTKSDTTVDGTAKFTAQDDGKVKLELELNVPKMANKSVAVHIHEHGDCGDAGKNTHGHWNPTNQQHGKWGSAAFHSGDIGNVSLDGSGKGTATLVTDLWTIGGDVQKDILGKAIIVHSGVDDYTSQPAGNAGSRIGCGVIEKK